jgi:hypothetical protein
MSGLLRGLAKLIIMSHSTTNGPSARACQAMPARPPTRDQAGPTASQSWPVEAQTIPATVGFEQLAEAGRIRLVHSLSLSYFTQLVSLELQ